MKHCRDYCLASAAACLMLVATSCGSTGTQSSGRVDFDVGYSSFQDGDAIQLTEIRGPNTTLSPGGAYTVKGSYSLASRDAAWMEVWCANGEVSGKKGRVVSKGAGEFQFQFGIVKPGYLHVSYYPANGGPSFGSVYFGQGDGVRHQ